MNTQVRIDSIVPNGIAGPEAEFLNLVYAALLKKYDQIFYTYVSLIQTDEEVGEIIFKKPGNKIHINMKYETVKNFSTLDNYEKSRIRLGFINSALLRIAEFDKKFDKQKLKLIRDEIVQNNFDFDLEYKKAFNERNNCTATLIIKPGSYSFDFYLIIKKGEDVVCKVPIYSGKTSPHYFSEIFHKLKWRNLNEVVIEDKKKEFFMIVSVNECEFGLINLTEFDEPPYLQIMRADITDEEQKKSREDWLKSLNPKIANIIKSADERLDSL